jgi:proline iminopeptidase
VIEEDDFRKGVPIRTIWTKNMYSRLSYADRLGEVRAPSLIMAGRHDPEAPLECSQELLEGIADSRLVVFEHSGHAPFIEEPALFTKILAEFLNQP